MKKIFSFLLAFLMPLSLCSCSSEPPFADLAPNYTISVPSYALSSHGFSDDSTPETHTNFEINEKGLVTRYDDGIGYITNTYDENGNKLMEADDSDFNGYTTVYTLDAEGREISTTTESVIDHIGTFYHEYTYNDRGLVETDHWHNDSGESDLTTYTYEYDEQGRVIYDESLEPVDYYRKIYEFTYDKNGNIDSCISTTYFSSDDEPSICKSYFFYDQFGRVVEEKRPEEGYSVLMSYSIAGTYDLSTETDSRLQTVDAWIPFEEVGNFPVPDSVISTFKLLESNAGQSYIYQIEQPELPTNAAHKAFWERYSVNTATLMKDANESYFAYLAILEQVLGFDVDEHADGSISIAQEDEQIAVIQYQCVDGIPCMAIAFE